MTFTDSRIFLGLLVVPNKGQSFLGTAMMSETCVGPGTDDGGNQSDTQHQNKTTNLIFLLVFWYSIFRSRLWHYHVIR